MAATTTTGFPGATAAHATDSIHAGVNRRRCISPQAGRAIIFLSHAIEYLSAEFVREDGSFSPGNAQLQAIQLLMTANRQVYCECPEVPPLSKRFLALFHLNAN